MKQSMHDLYDVQKTYTRGSDEWIQLEVQMKDMSKTLTIPKNINSKK